MNFATQVNFSPGPVNTFNVNPDIISTQENLDNYIIVANF